MDMEAIIKKMKMTIIKKGAEKKLRGVLKTNDISLLTASSIKYIPLPWWFNTSFIKIMSHLKDKKGFRYNMNNKKSRLYFNNDSCLSRQLSYPNFY